jgi:hypothetical protein
MGLNNIQELTHIIEDDATKESRFPVRFILVDGIDSWRQVLDLLKTRSNMVRLSAFCSDTDTYPLFSLSDLISILNREVKRNISIVPVAELLRLREEKTSEMVVSLATYENVGHRRIYVPLFQCSEPFHRALGRSSRWHAGELSPIWKAGTVPDYFTVTVSPIRLNINDNSLHIEGVRGYLEAWEKGQVRGQSIYIKSDMAKGGKNVHGPINLKVYKSSYEALVDNLQGSTYLESEWGTDAHWEWLTNEVKLADDFGMLAGRLLNLANYDFWQIAQEWEHLEENKKWLFWLWTRLERPGVYIGVVVRNTKSPADFEQSMATCVFNEDCDFSDQVLDERKEVLEALGIVELPSEFWQRFDQAKDPLFKLQVLTGLTIKEKKEAILAVAELFEHGTSINEILPYLHRAYPALAQYLSPFENESLREYLQIFNRCRVMNKRTQELDDISEVVNESDTIFQFELRDKFLEQIRASSVHEIWVDALGVQWMPFIKEYLEKYGNHVEVKIQVARANLPSVTGSNRNWAPDAELIRELDQAGHSYDHKYPRSIVNEINIVEEALRVALESVRRGQIVLITSDHGATPYGFAKGSSVSIPETGEVHKWGRCAKVLTITDEIASNRGWIEENMWLCLRGHNRFETGTGANPDCLVHGGATLEEALVPVVQIWIKKPILKELITLTVPRLEAQIDADGNARLLDVAVSPDPGELIMRTKDNRVFLGIRRKEGAYDFVMSPVSLGAYHVVFESQGQIIGKAMIRVIVGGLEERDLGI